MDRKAEIRSRAAELFAERGFHGTSIRDVARATGTSLAGLYHYYRGKEEILRDIQHLSLEQLLDTHAEALAGVREPERKLEAVIRAHVGFFARNLASMRVMVREENTLTGAYAEEVAELKRRYFRLVRGIVDELRRDGRLADVDPSLAGFLLFGMMNWLHAWYEPDRDGDPETIAAAVLRIFLHGVLRPAATR